MSLLDEKPGGLALLLREISRGELQQFFPREAEFFAESLKVDEGRSQIVRNAVNEHLDLFVLVAEIIIGAREFGGPAFESLLIDALLEAGAFQVIGHGVEFLVQFTNLVRAADQRRQDFRRFRSAAYFPPRP